MAHHTDEAARFSVRYLGSDHPDGEVYYLGMRRADGSHLPGHRVYWPTERGLFPPSWGSRIVSVLEALRSSGDSVLLDRDCNIVEDRYP